MKAIRILSRLVLLALAAAAFTLLTTALATSMHTPSPAPHWKLNRSPAPGISQFPEFLGAGIVVAVCAVAGRIVFRLRLSPSPKSQKPLSLFGSND